MDIVQTKLEAFNRAEDAWQAELETVYGYGAIEARYNSILNKATDTLAVLRSARVTAMAEYENAIREHRLSGTPFQGSK